MSLIEIEQLYDWHIKPLPVEARLQLLSVIARDLAEENNEPPKTHSIMELHGLGKEIWEGIDAQEYVNELRREWDHRP